MEPVIFKTRLSLEDFLAISERLSWRMLLQPVRLAIYGVVLVVLVLQATYTGRWYGPIILVAVIAALAAVMYVRIPLSLRKKYKENFRNQEEMEYHINETTCRITGQTFHLDVPWDKVLRVERWRNWYLLYITKYQAHVIQAADLGPGQEEALLRLLDRVKPGWCT